MIKDKEPFVFEGVFGTPPTQVTDDVFSEIMPNVSAAEFKAFCYLLWMSEGWMKTGEPMTVEGLAEGTGLSRARALIAAEGCVKKGLAEVERGGAGWPDTYILRYSDEDKQKRRDYEEAKALGARRGTPRTASERERGRVSKKHHSLYKKLVALDGEACQRCGSTEGLQIDHILPVIRGGTSEVDNLQLLCQPCNNWKGTQDIRFVQR